MHSGYQSSAFDGVKIAEDIKARCKALKRSIQSIFQEADVNYRNYTAWRSGQNDPSFASLRPVYAVLEMYEATREGDGMK